MVMQVLVDFFHGAAFEAVSCVWLELSMFAVATTAYVLFVQGSFGNATGASKSSQVYG
jgi:hypothetical protein